MTIFALVLTHFNQISGPEIVYSFPEEVPKELSQKMKTYFNINVEDSFFEINLVKENLILINLYFEIPSEKARGGVDMTMLSVITDKEHKTEVFHEALRECSNRILSADKMYTCFYKECGDDHKKNREILRTHLTECLKRLRAEITPGETNVKLINKFKKLKW